MNRSSVPLVFALILISLGVGLLLRNLGCPFILGYLSVYWPVFLIVMGLWALARVLYLQKTDEPVKSDIIAGEFLFALLIIAGGLGGTHSYLAALNVRQVAPRTWATTYSPTLVVPRGCPVLIENSTGDIQVDTWPKDKVSVYAETKLPHPFLNLWALERVEISTQVIGNQCQIKTIYHPDKVWVSHPEAIAVDYQISVPESSRSVKIITRTGNILVKRIRGNVDITNKVGHIWVQNIAGDLKVANQRGDIEIFASGKSVTVRSSTGEIKVVTTNPVAYPYKITNGIGNIVLELPKSSPVLFNARTNAGIFSSNLSLKHVRPQPGMCGALQGSLGKGKVPVILRVDIGKIHILGRETQIIHDE